MNGNLKPTILVVDDEADLTDVIAFHLEHLGLNTVLAHSGPEAYEHVQTKKIDLVISDVRMPKGDGIELLKDIKRIKPDLPVVLISGFADVNEAEAKRLGAQALLPKPMGISDITRIVQKILKL